MSVPERMKKMVIEEEKYEQEKRKILDELHAYIGKFCDIDQRNIEELCLKSFRTGVVLASGERDELKAENVRLRQHEREYMVNSQESYFEVVAMKNRLKRVLQFVIDEM